MVTTISSFAVGVVMWPALEFALHNWLGHVARGKNAFSREHLKHHAVKDFFAPSWKKAAAAVPVFSVVGAASTALLGRAEGIALTSGFAVTYLAYEVVHRRCHTSPPRGPYSRWARKNHFYHHFMSPKTNHGVTTPFFDMLAGTYRKPDVVRVPERFAMDWLVDAQTGEVREEFRSDYELRRAPKSAAHRAATSEEDLAAAYAGSAPSA